MSNRSQRSPSASNQSLPLEAVAVRRAWGENRAVNDISLQLRTGEIYGLVGPDGAGKTTLIRILVSLVVPDTGQVRLWGHDTLKQRAYVRSHVGYMPQRFSLYPDLTVAQNLRFFGDLYAVPRAEQKRRTERLYRFSHLTEFKERRAGQLSGGMKQKLALSCVLMHSPQVILLDEPTVGVDPVSRRELWDILRELRGEETAILVSTPYMEEAEQCDRVGLIHAGRLLAEDSPAELIAKSTSKIVRLQTEHPLQTWEQLAQAGMTGQAQLFGDSIHLTLEPGLTSEDLATRLQAAAVPFQQLTGVPPSMEDLFLASLQAADTEREGGNV